MITEKVSLNSEASFKRYWFTLAPKYLRKLDCQWGMYFILVPQTNLHMFYEVPILLSSFSGDVAIVLR